MEEKSSLSVSMPSVDTKEKYDIFRDSPLRYAGYANEVGESFRYQFPKLVVPSYIVAFGYCCADAATSGYDAYKANEKDETRLSHSIYATADTLLWQSLASVTIPGACINLIVKASRFAVKKSPFVLPGLVAKWAPTGIGLSAIPLIIQPIDHAVDYLLDNTTRKWWHESK